LPAPYFSNFTRCLIFLFAKSSYPTIEPQLSLQICRNFGEGIELSINGKQCSR
jgi:hypothetical protein